jgi:hypothetical protein
VGRLLRFAQLLLLTIFTLTVATASASVAVGPPAVQYEYAYDAEPCVTNWHEARTTADAVIAHALDPSIKSASSPIRVTSGGRVTTSRPTVATKCVGGAMSFGGETLVLMADGTAKPISEVEVGDMVLAQDPETSEIGARKVTATWVHDDDLVRLEIDGDIVRTTEDHPFWNDTDKQWQRADQLDSGDLALTADGRRVKFGILLGAAGRGLAYNLSVQGIHTYHVLFGADAVLVHIVCPVVELAGQALVGKVPAKVVNTEMAHAAGQAAKYGRAGFSSAAEARAALQDLGRAIEANGFPVGTIWDSHVDRVLVPVGVRGYAVYQLKSNGNAVLRNVLNER